MDWSFYAESAWRASDSLELVPDLVAWLVCSCVALRLAYVVIYRRPRACLVCLAAWLGWLAWQAIGVSGIEALHAAKRKGLAAFEATEHFNGKLLALVKAWTDFFLPFLSDVCRWSMRVWKKLSLRSRLFFIGGLLCSYALLEVVRMFRRHHKLIFHLLFHASFLVGGPLLWFSCGLLPADVLPQITLHAITTFPAVMSLLTISCAPNPSTSMMARRSTQSRSVIPALPTSNLDMHRLWLSYWACWPVLALLEAAVVGVVPKLMQEGPNSRPLQVDLHRGLFTFVVWLQFWQGSRLLQFTMQSMLFNTSILEHLARFSGSRGLQALSILRGGLAAGATPFGGMRLFRLVGYLTTRLWLALTVAAVAVAGLLLFVTLCYRVVSEISRAATMLLWLAAASDSADTLSRHAEDFYTKKLSFWVMAMIWEALTRIPYIGVVLRLVTPISFALWLLVGETAVRRLVLPLFRFVAAPVRAILASRDAPVAIVDAPEEEPAYGDTGADCKMLAGPEEPACGDTGGHPRARDLPETDGRAEGDSLQDATYTTGNATGGVGGLEDDDTRMDGADTGGTGVPAVNADHTSPLASSAVRKRKKVGKKG